MCSMVSSWSSFRRGVEILDTFRKIWVETRINWRLSSDDMSPLVVSSLIDVFGKHIPGIRNDKVRAAILASASLPLSPRVGRYFFARNLSHNQKER